jgi:alpha-1,2-mannosyltransferase
VADHPSLHEAASLDKRTPIMTGKRLRNYPRVIGIAIWVVFLFNLATHYYWEGGLGGVIGLDFVPNYGAGLLYWSDVEHMYDVPTQAQLQQELFSPMQLEGKVNVFSYPPHAALLYSLFTLLPLPAAFGVWSLLSIVLSAAAIYWIARTLLPQRLRQAGLDGWQLLIILGSFFPFVIGLYIGQNHAISLFLVTGIVLCTLSGREYAAGLLAGLLMYKPHLAIGFLILWLMRRQYRALASFAVVSAIWGGAVLLTRGIAPYQTYLREIPTLLNLPHVQGGPSEVTPYGMLITLLPAGIGQRISWLSTVFVGIGSLAFGWFLYRQRASFDLRPALALAVLLPFLIAPHILMHDLFLLLLMLLLVAQYSDSRRLVYAAIAVYLGGFVLFPLSHLIEVALWALLPLGLLVLFSQELPRQKGEPGGAPPG